MNTSKRFVGEVVELSRDCELGQEGDRAVVTALVGRYMTLTFPDRAPDCRAVHTGADYKYLRAYEGIVEWSAADLASSKPVSTPVERAAALQELRALVATYLEGSDDNARATELLDALDKPASSAPARPAQTLSMPDDQARAMFGCTAQAIDQTLNGKEPRDVALFAIGTLSDAQELIPGRGAVSERDANTIRQRVNIAKYVIDKAVPR